MAVYKSRAICCILTLYFLSSADTRSICKQREFGVMEVLVCPPHNETSSDFKYCCTNNGLMSCCDFNDYQQRHSGPSLTTTCVVILCEVLLVILLVIWCYIYGYRK